MSARSRPGGGVRIESGWRRCGNVVDGICGECDWSVVVVSYDFCWKV